MVDQSNLIDPLDENTYGRGGAIIGGIRSYLTGPAWDRWVKKRKNGFNSQRKALLHELYVLKTLLWKELHK